MENIASELIEDIIFWEKHTEIYESLESIIRSRYNVRTKDSEALAKKDGIKFLLDTVCEARMESPDELRKLEPVLTDKFIIVKYDKEA